MREAAVFQMPAQLRQLFVDICMHCNPANGLALFDNHQQHLSEDYERRGHFIEVTKNIALMTAQLNREQRAFID